eukprot:TRINITY_DN3770_c0_g1_i1.p1 TRINITY_DN3770_c0_g1~~TRINITY_DN3770_c0_g1_i1.p1  ORF type:complete len:301 (+),score=49.96 TRINITY_DN3770_c0_g1_i1:164-1066(+)
MSSDEGEKVNHSAVHILKLLIKDQQLKEDICAAKFIPTSVIDKEGNAKPRSKKNILNSLINECWSTGLKKTLDCLTRNKIKDILAPRVQWTDDRVPTSKSVLVKRIHEEIIKKDAREFFSEIKKSDLRILLDELDEEIPSSRDEYVDALLDTIERFGLQNLFSSFNEKKLKLMIEECGLVVSSTSKDIMIDCLLNQEDWKPSKKKVKPEKVSKKKPKIKNGITKADLQSHYYRDELYDYCREHDLNTTGNKKDFINRILAYVEGREQPKVNKKGAMLKKRKKRKTATDTDEESSAKKKKI